MRITLPFVVPLACLLGILVFPDQAAPLSAALVASIVTLGLAAPALFSATASPEASSPEASPAAAAERAASSVSKPVSSVSWAKSLWWAGVALEVAAVIWTFVSLGGLVIAPENAQSWSLHLGGAMLLVMFWTPLIVFIRPSDADSSTSQEVETGEEETQAFVPEAEKRLRTSVSSRGNRDAPGSQEAADRSLWEFGESGGDSFTSEDSPSMAARSADANQGDEAHQEIGPDTSEMWAAAWPDDDPETTATAAASTETAPADVSPTSANVSDARKQSDARRQSDAQKQEADEHAERRALWSFPDDEDNASAEQASASEATTSRELEAAQKAATAPWGDDNADQEEEMAWDILESILEEEESRSRSSDDDEGSWEPDEWPDFNYDV